jgi:hypothetical protein
VKGVNLIPLGLRAARSRNRRMRRWALACASYAAVVLVTCALIGKCWTADCQTIDRSNASASQKIEEDNRALASRRAQLAEKQEQSRTAEAIQGQPDWSYLLGGIASQMGDDLVLREVRLGAAPGNENRGVADALTGPRRFLFSIHGVSRTGTGVSKFVSDLEKLQFFDDVKLLRTSRETFLNGPATGFEVETSFGQEQGRTK